MRCFNGFLFKIPKSRQRFLKSGKCKHVPGNHEVYNNKRELHFIENKYKHIIKTAFFLHLKVGHKFQILQRN